MLRALVSIPLSAEGLGLGPGPGREKDLVKGAN